MYLFCRCKGFCGRICDNLEVDDDDKMVYIENA